MSNSVSIYKRNAKIVQILSYKYPPIILPTLLLRAEFSSFYIRHIDNTTQNHKAIITSLHVMSVLLLLNGYYNSLSENAFILQLLSQMTLITCTSTSQYIAFIVCQIPSLIYSTVLVHLLASNNAYNLVLSHEQSTRGVLVILT